MKRFFSLLLVLCMLSPSALAESSLVLPAVVTLRETLALKAPASGELAPFTVREGDVVSTGDVLLSVEPVRVYADIEGTVGIVNAEAGDIADPVCERYGGILLIEPADRYVVHSNVRTGANNSDNRDLHVGIPVYLLSNNGEHTADGVVTNVDGQNFTVQVIGGDLVYIQDLKIYRDPDHTSSSLLGRGSLSTAAPRAYTASGTLVEVGVNAGDEVQPGDFLFSYVPDQLAPERRGRKDALELQADEALIITGVNVQPGASVQKGQPMLTAIRPGDYELTAQAEEGELAQLAVGQEMTVCFEELELASLTATITAISPLGTDGGDVSTYAVRLRFEVPEGIYPGMHAVVEK